MTSRSSQYMHQRVWNDQPYFNLNFLPTSLIRPGDRVYCCVSGERQFFGTVLAVQTLGGGLHVSFAERRPITTHPYVSHWVLRPA